MSYRLLIVIMKSRLTPPVHEVKYASQMKSLLIKHLKGMKSVSEEIDVFVTKTLTYVSESAPEFVKPLYETFSTMELELSKSFKSFCEKLEPILKSTDSILDRREAVRLALREYQDKLWNVRKTEDESTIEEEKNALLKFADQLENLNKDSNNFVLAFLTLYAACAAQMILDLKPMNDTISAIGSNPDAGEPTKEEQELDELIAELEKEVAQLPPPPE